MATRMQRTERLLNLFTFLLNSREPRSANDIKEQVPHYGESRSEVSFRRILGRDVQTLRGVGVPVEVDAEGGYRVLPRAYHLPLLDLSEEELGGLVLAYRIVSDLAPPLREGAESALRKLAFGNWDDLRVAEQRQGDLDFEVLRARPGLSGEAFESILEAVLKRRTLRIRYRARTSGRASVRDVDPYGLAIHEGQWYLVGFCHLRKEVRTFKGIRMQRVEISPFSRQCDNFPVPEGFDLREHLGIPRWRRSKGTPPFEAEVRFDEEVWWWVRDNWVDFGSMEEDRGGGRLRTQVRDAEALIGTVLEFGGHAEVKEPEFLRQQLCTALERIVSMHV